MRQRARVRGLGWVACVGQRYLLANTRPRGTKAMASEKRARLQSTHAPTVGEASLQTQMRKTCVFPQGSSVVGIVGFGGDSSRLEAA